VSGRLTSCQFEPAWVVEGSMRKRWAVNCTDCPPPWLMNHGATAQTTSTSASAAPIQALKASR
jgi:hypothetical protein